MSSVRRLAPLLFHIALCLPLAHAAPAPREKPKAAPAVVAGDWELLWGGTVWRYRLLPDGACHGWREGDGGATVGPYWAGKWSWDAKASALRVEDRCDDTGAVMDWTARLKVDAERQWTFVGEAKCDQGGEVTFALRPAVGERKKL